MALIIVGLVAAYYAVWLGDLAAFTFHNHSHVRASIGALNLLIFVCGGTAVTYAFYVMSEGNTLDGELMSIAGFLCGAYLFGAFSMPITRHGGFLWNWGDPWLALPVIAFIPVAAVAAETAVELRSSWRKS